MHSEPTEALSQVSTQSTISELPTVSQYGFHYSPTGSRDEYDFISEESSASSPAHSVASDSRRSTSQNTAQGRPGRVNSSGRSPTKPSFRRISEYENALAPISPRRTSEGLGFKVVQSKNSRADGPQLDKFPNEVLTHILSHLPATSLATVSLVCRRFYSLVTTPHAWRVAFARFFPGHDSVAVKPGQTVVEVSHEKILSEVRFFTRLTALASWRSEYILRTRLLRSLGRGRPAQAPSSRGNHGQNSSASNSNAVLTYNSQLFATVNHIHATFNNDKKRPRFIHGTDETGTACTSDPYTGKIDNWGLSDPHASQQFADLFPGDQAYGLGDGPAGLPNVMDVSQPYGLISGEGFPGGQAYFRSSEEMRGRFLLQPNAMSDVNAGIPNIPNPMFEAISAVWIAKSNAIPALSGGLIGMMTGSTYGILTAYSLGVDNNQRRRIPKGHITARWVLSPGVPIIAIRVDESYNAKRIASGRIWAIALNALGEVFYLNEILPFSSVDPKLDELEAIRGAWDCGRLVCWELADPSRRIARPDPFKEAETRGDYSPRSSCNAMNLSKGQLIAEAREIETFLRYRPSHFRKFCEGWDMRRKLEVDFAGDDGNGAGENVFVVGCGFDGAEAEIKRFTRLKSERAPLNDVSLPNTPSAAVQTVPVTSIFGDGKFIQTQPIQPSSEPLTRVETPSISPPTDIRVEWRSSLLSLKSNPRVEITTSTMDMSTYSLLLNSEDPLYGMSSTTSTSSTPFMTPSEQVGSKAEIPGHRARLLAIGTNTGVVLIFNSRGLQSSSPTLVNELQPLRIIYTDSPQISCLALSALYLVHGGNDGLVQAWDPLASTLQPVRTLNSRFSSRARRRLVQAEASVFGVGINLFAAGALVLDPDPTVLRGMVSLGTHLRFWSYSSSTADQYKGKKRRLRRSSERGSNSGPDRFSTTGRGALMDYIATEQEEIKNEKFRREREEARLRGRFGVGLGGLTDEEAIKYAEMISVESFQKEAERRVTDPGYVADSGESSSVQSGWSSDTVTPEGSVQSHASPSYERAGEYDHDLEEAIRLSLLDGPDEVDTSPTAGASIGFNIPITYKSKKSKHSPSTSPPTSHATKNWSSSSAKSPNDDSFATDDLELAIQLSLAEEKSRLDNSGDVSGFFEEDFPELEREVTGKGKGRAN
ncbi:hypothetical protein F5884DRAFT_672228 [Xylogone sp. PMI_703]|nr:hypothetical protein F5884DRAFT_672228 [Xylogone sp. PMI_703]